GGRRGDGRRRGVGRGLRDRRQLRSGADGGRRRRLGGGGRGGGRVAGDRGRRRRRPGLEVVRGVHHAVGSHGDADAHDAEGRIDEVLVVVGAGDEGVEQGVHLRAHSHVLARLG